MIPRDSQTGNIIVEAISPRRAAVLCWLLDHGSVIWSSVFFTGPGTLGREQEKTLERGLKTAGFYAANTNSIEVDMRTFEAAEIYQMGLRARTRLRRLAASYNP